MATIGVAAKRAGCNVETVRYYERIGLLQTPPRSNSGRRSYGNGEIERLQFIRRCRDLGFTLKDVEALTALTDPGLGNCDRAKKLAEAQIVSVRQKMADLLRVEAWLAKTIEQCSSSQDTCCPLIENLRAPSTRVC